MASVSITRRRTKSGTRYIVRYRLGGRPYPITHGGSFSRERDAKTRRDFIAGELAANRNPAEALRAMAQPQALTRTFRQVRRSTARPASTSTRQRGRTTRRTSSRLRCSMTATRTASPTRTFRSGWTAPACRSQA
jgi:hypothetical protein